MATISNNLAQTPSTIEDVIRYLGAGYFPGSYVTTTYQAVNYLPDYRGRTRDISSYKNNSIYKRLRVEAQFDWYNMTANTDILTLEFVVGTVVICDIPIDISSYTVSAQSHVLINVWFEHLIDTAGAYQGPCHFGTTYSLISHAGLMTTGGAIAPVKEFKGASYPTLNTTNMSVGVKAKCSANGGVATLFVDAMKIMY